MNCCYGGNVSALSSISHDSRYFSSSGCKTIELYASALFASAQRAKKSFEVQCQDNGNLSVLRDWPCGLASYSIRELGNVGISVSANRIFMRCSVFGTMWLSGSRRYRKYYNHKVGEDRLTLRTNLSSRRRRKSRTLSENIRCSITISVGCNRFINIINRSCDNCSRKLRFR